MTGKTSLTVIKGLKVARGSARKRQDTLRLTLADVDRWKVPPFQRPLKVTPKLREIAEELKENGGVIKGSLLLGVFKGDTYLVDGQHRIEAFRMSGLDEVYADVRIGDYDSMAEMAEDFAEENSSIVSMGPDDRLRALAVAHRPMQTILAGCPYVGFGMVRRGEASPILSMSVVLRMWAGSAVETPVSATKGAQTLAEALTDDDAHRIVDFLGTVYGAWGRDAEYNRLWAALNLTLCAWIWRRTVIGKYKAVTIALTREQFHHCAMRVSASSQYLDWLGGRKLGERDRSPCFQRLRQIFTASLREEGVVAKKLRFPDPPWSTGGGRVIDL